MSKPDFWEIVDLLDGRMALQRNGLVVRVAHTRDELNDYFETIFPRQFVEDPVKAMDRAIRRTAYR